MNGRSIGKQSFISTLASCILGALFSHAAVAADLAPVTKGAGKPDFSGVYRRQGFPQQIKDLSFMKPWVSQEVLRRREAMRNSRPLPTTITMCQPAGPLAMWLDAHHIGMVQTADELIVMGETDHQVRHIYINGKHPVNLVRTWGGHSIGHWQGNTLVVDTVGFNDKVALDSSSTPHSEALHVVERISMLPDGKVDVNVTIEDPLALNAPWVLSHQLAKQEEKFVQEYACAENNHDDKQMEGPLLDNLGTRDNRGH